MTNLNAGLIGARVSLSTWTGWKVNGRVVGICHDPTLIVEDDEGNRTTLSARAVKELRETEEKA